MPLLTTWGPPLAGAAMTRLQRFSSGPASCLPPSRRQRPGACELPGERIPRRGAGDAFRRDPSYRPKPPMHCGKPVRCPFIDVPAAAAEAAHLPRERSWHESRGCPFRLPYGCRMSAMAGWRTRHAPPIFAPAWKRPPVRQEPRRAVLLPRRLLDVPGMPEKRALEYGLHAMSSGIRRAQMAGRGRLPHGAHRAGARRRWNEERIGGPAISPLASSL